MDTSVDSVIRIKFLDSWLCYFIRYRTMGSSFHKSVKRASNINEECGCRDLKNKIGDVLTLPGT